MSVDDWGHLVWPGEREWEGEPWFAVVMTVGNGIRARVMGSGMKSDHRVAEEIRFGRRLDGNISPPDALELAGCGSWKNGKEGGWEGGKCYLY